jgi:hypothetical protein
MVWLILKGASIDRLKKFVTESSLKELQERHFSSQYWPEDEFLARERFLKGLLSSVANLDAWLRPYVDAVLKLRCLTVKNFWACAKDGVISVFFDCELEKHGIMSVLYEMESKGDFSLKHHVCFHHFENMQPSDFGLPQKIKVDEEEK